MSFNFLTELGGPESEARTNHNVDASQRSRGSVPDLGRGNIVKAKVISTSPVQIAHGLGKLPTGYNVICMDKGASIFEVSRDKEFFTLQSTVADTKVDIWFF